MSSRAVHTEPARSGSIRLRPQHEPIPLFSVARAPDVAARTEPRELWVGVHLPWLAVEALGSPPLSAGSGSHRLPRAVIELQGQTQYVVAVCELAGRWGIRPGMSLAAALALNPHLDTKPRDIQSEQQLLERLAARAQRFTPRVTLVPPDGLVLEVKGSLHLFGGPEALCRALENECHATGAKPILSLAPFPLAALAAARGGKTFIVTETAHLIGQIAALPLTTLRWPSEVLQRLAQIGVSTIGEALRLPRAGFARRFGKDQLAMLDRLVGRDADLRPAYRVRERFRCRHELLYELEQHESLLATLEPLLQELGAFLKARQCGITRLDCLFHHRQAPATHCVLRLAAPASSARHFAKLLGERLSALSLPEPVRAIELRSGGLVLRAPAAESLWKPGEHGGQSCAESTELIEHLRARLGHEAVYGLKLFASHRPESAWTAAELAAAPRTCSAERNTQASIARGRRSGPAPDSPPWPAFRRPLWLLPVPERLIEKDGRLCRLTVRTAACADSQRHALERLAGPERIETGWWDGGDIERDYYVARDADGVRLWIFRERTAPHRWFLHGVFG